MLDEENTGQVQIGGLFSCLYQYVPKLNIMDINKKTQSTWTEKLKRLKNDEKTLFKTLAEEIKKMDQGRILTY